jgi:peptide/nickel transport system substrate-binding protein
MPSQILRRSRRHLLLAGALALFVAGCGSSSKPSGPTGKPVQGGTATLAELPNQTPNYIFPMYPIQYCFSANTQFLTYLMWRPLYFFGNGTAPVLNTSVSIANPPVYSRHDTVATVTLKNYQWSDGTPVTAADVQFWQNLVTANKQNWCVYAPGNYPDNVASTKITGPRTIEFHLTHGVNPTWFTSNELSQIQPLPIQAMDKTSASSPSRRYDQTTSGAVAVFKYLSSQGSKISSYTTSPLWKVVDGPWKLQTFSQNGQVSFVPNARYSGPVKPHLSRFTELPFTSDTAELNALRSGQVDVGYLPYEDLPQRGALTAAGYNLAPWQVYVTNYIANNQNNPIVGPILKQTYVRQALEMLVDQQGVIKAFYSGYAQPTCGPVPFSSGTDLSSSYEKSCPFAFNPARAIALLKSHGWTIVPGGVSYCSSPGSGAGHCGPGVKQGARLSFTFNYATGVEALVRSVQVFKSDAAKAGIQYKLIGGSFATVSSIAVPCKAGASVCNWQLADWGEGWLYTPNFDPAGEIIFETGGGGNSSSYSDPINDANVRANVGPGGSQAMLNKFQDYLTNQVPFIWQQDAPYQLSEIKSTLAGVTPQNVYFAVLPENWYFTK